MLVSGAARTALPDAAVLDLTVPEDQGRSTHYAHAVQSMMLFDRRGEVRVRRSERTAPRTVVAMERSGKLIVMVTEGSYTLWDLADLLRNGGWGLVSAMALDGGREANLAVAAGAVRYASYQAESDGERDPYFRESVTLPAVVAVRPADRRRSRNTPLPFPTTP
jgi:hypothetical protein